MGGEGTCILACSRRSSRSRVVTHGRPTLGTLGKEGTVMFNTLDEQITQAEGTSLSTKERLVRYAALTIISMIVFAGLYLAIRLV